MRSMERRKSATLVSTSLVSGRLQNAGLIYRFKIDRRTTKAALSCRLQPAKKCGFQETRTLPRYNFLYSLFLVRRFLAFFSSGLRARRRSACVRAGLLRAVRLSSGGGAGSAAIVRAGRVAGSSAWLRRAIWRLRSLSCRRC